MKKTKEERFLEYMEQFEAEGTNSASAAAFFVRGLFAWQQKDMEAAFELFKTAADKGNPDAMLLIGDMFFHEGFRATPFFNIQNAISQPSLNMFQSRPNYEEAVFWYRKAAEAGIYEAMNNLGIMLNSGLGCKKDENEARTWVLKSAKSGNPYAIKAAKDLFNVDSFSTEIPNEEYDCTLNEFCRLIESDDFDSLRINDLYGMLINGNDSQLIKLNYRICLGLYNRSDKYATFTYRNLSNLSNGAPISFHRVGWATLIVINMDYFPEGARFSFASDINSGLYCISNIKYIGTAQYYAEEFGWLSGTRHASLLELDRTYKSTVTQKDFDYLDIQLGEIQKDIKPNEAVLIENGEKEFSVEMCYVTEDDAKVVLRYTIGGWDQGERCAKVTCFRIE